MCEHGTWGRAYNCECWICAQSHPPLTSKGLLLGIAFGLLVALGIGHVKAQEVHLHGHSAAEMPIHEKFYSKWNRPNGGAERKNSCCNKEDCHQTEVRIINGVCSALKPMTPGIRFDDTGAEAHDPAGDKPAHWVTFSCTLLEESQRDPEESPDGLSHACIARYTDTVYCAVRGSLQ